MITRWRNSGKANPVKIASAKRKKPGLLPAFHAKNFYTISHREMVLFPKKEAGKIEAGKIIPGFVIVISFKPLVS
ncbi:MAG: hypothetical protein ABIW93_05980 [Verrucomicrobiota bacterium]